MIGRMLALLTLARGPDLSDAATREVARQECRLKDEAAAITVCGRREQRHRYQVTNPTAPMPPAATSRAS